MSLTHIIDKVTHIHFIENPNPMKWISVEWFSMKWISPDKICLLLFKQLNVILKVNQQIILWTVFLKSINLQHLGSSERMDRMEKHNHLNYIHNIMCAGKT